MLSIPAQSIPADGVVDYRYLDVATTFPTDTWVRAAVVRPGNRKVVHHCLVYFGSDSFFKGLLGFFAGYVPGSDPAASPATTMSGSEPTQREINPRMTTESSTTMTRSGSSSVDFGAKGFTNATLITHQTRLKRHDKQTPMAAAAGSMGVDQIRPTSWNFAVTMSLSNGFMMYSLAPA